MSGQLVSKDFFGPGTTQHTIVPRGHGDKVINAGVDFHERVSWSPKASECIQLFSLFHPPRIFPSFSRSRFAAEGTFKPAAHNQQLCVFCFVPMLVLAAGRPILPPEGQCCFKRTQGFLMYPGGGSPGSLCAPFLCECAEGPRVWRWDGEPEATPLS